jgi:hypothetical protein
MQNNSGLPRSEILAEPAAYLPLPVPRRRALLNAGVAGRVMIALPAAMSIGIVLTSPAHAQLTHSTGSGGGKLSAVNFAGYKAVVITSSSTIASPAANFPSASAVYGSVAAISNAASAGSGITLASSTPASGADVAAPGYGVTIGNLASVTAGYRPASSAIAPPPAGVAVPSGLSLAEGHNLSVPEPGPGGYSGAAGLGAAGAIINRGTVAEISVQVSPSLSSGDFAMADGSFNRDSGGIVIGNGWDAGRAPETPFKSTAMQSDIIQGRALHYAGDMPSGLAITNSSGGIISGNAGDILTGGAVAANGGPAADGPVAMPGGGFGFHASEEITRTDSFAPHMGGGVNVNAVYGGTLTPHLAEPAQPVNAGMAAAHEAVIIAGYGKLSGHECISLEAAGRITNASAVLATGLLDARYSGSAREAVAITPPMNVSAGHSGDLLADAARLEVVAGGSAAGAGLPRVSANSGRAHDTAEFAAMRLGGSEIASAVSSPSLLTADDIAASVGTINAGGISTAAGRGAVGIASQAGIIANLGPGIAIGGDITINTGPGAGAGGQVPALAGNPVIAETGFIPGAGMATPARAPIDSAVSAIAAGKLIYQQISANVVAFASADGGTSFTASGGQSVNRPNARPGPAAAGIGPADASGAMPISNTARGIGASGVVADAGFTTAVIAQTIREIGGVSPSSTAQNVAPITSGALKMNLAASGPAANAAGSSTGISTAAPSAPPAIASSRLIAATVPAIPAELPADPGNLTGPAVTGLQLAVNAGSAPGSALIFGYIRTGSAVSGSGPADRVPESAPPAPVSTAAIIGVDVHQIPNHSEIPARTAQAAINSTSLPAIAPTARATFIRAAGSAPATASAGATLVIQTALDTASFAQASPAGIIKSKFVTAETAPPILPGGGIAEIQSPALAPIPFNPVFRTNSVALADTVIADTPATSGTLFGSNVTASGQAIIADASLNSSGAGVINAGRIIKASGTGLALNGGILFNAPTGVIQGDPVGMIVTGGAAVTNAGLILDAGTAGLELGNFSHVTNVPTGTIAGTTGLAFTGTGSTMLNEGTIASTSGGDAVSFSSGGVNFLTLTTGQALFGAIDGGGSNSTIALDGIGALTSTITDFGPASSLDLAPGASWTAYGSWQIHTATNDGTFQPGIIGTPLNLSGNFVQNAGGTLQIIVTPAATNQLLATGTARLDGALSYAFAPGTYVAKSYPFLITGGATTGTFASITYNGAPANLLHTTTYETNDTSLVLYNPGSPAPASNPVPNPPLVVAPIDTSIFSDENQQNALNAQAASMSLLQKAAEGDQEEAESAVCASEAGTTPANVEPDKATGTEQLANAVGNAFCGAGGWIQGTGTIFNADGNANVDGYQANTAGFLAGIGKVLNNQGTRLGVAVGYDESSVKTSIGSKGNVDTLRVGLYGSQPVGVFTIAADFMYGHFDTTTSRVTGIGDAGSKESGDIFSGGIEAETLLPIDGFDIIPAAGIRIAAVNTGRFTESAPGAEEAFALDGAKSGYDSVQPFVNVDLSRKFMTPNEISIMPDILAGYVYEAGTRGRAVTVDAQDGTSFETDHLGLAGSAAELQAGLSAGEGNWAFYVRYTADLAGNWTSQTGEAGLRIRF